MTTSAPATVSQPLLACRHVVARVALSDPGGWIYIAFSPLLVNLGTGPAWDVRLSMHPLDHAALTQAGCLVWAGSPGTIAPRVQEGEAAVIALERELAEGLHVQKMSAGDLPADSWVLGIPEAKLAQMPAGWLPIFETADTSVDLERPGRWECAMPSDLVYGVCTYAFDRARGAGLHDHFLALPFNRIYVPAGWTPPPALIDVDGN
jgi:hypothetical protein